jgi:hypothetical protein
VADRPLHVNRVPVHDGRDRQVETRSAIGLVPALAVHVERVRQNASANMPAGRPGGSTKLKGDDATLERIKTLAKIQCTQLDAAGVLKVCEKTFINFLQ